MDPQQEGEPSSCKDSDIGEREDKEELEQQQLSPQQQAQRELIQCYQQQVDPHPKGNNGVHHYYGGQPLVDPTFWAVQYQLDHELEKFPPIDSHKMRIWLEHHDPAYPDDISLKYSTFEKLYIESILAKLWTKAYKRTVWAVTDILLGKFLGVDYGHLPDWIGYTWHLHFGPQVIYKRALEIQLVLCPIIDIECRPFATKVAIYKAARSIIQDLHPQLATLVRPLSHNLATNLLL